MRGTSAMVFRVVLVGWLAGLQAALAAYVAFDAAVLTAFGIWSAAGTAAFLISAWSVAREDGGAMQRAVEVAFG